LDLKNDFPPTNQFSATGVNIRECVLNLMNLKKRKIAKKGIWIFGDVRKTYKL